MVVKNRLSLIIVIWLSWIQPLVNSDGTTLTDLAGNKLYCGKISRNYSYTRDLGMRASPGDTAYLWIDNNSIPSGTWYCSVTAYDANKSESSFSNEVHGTK